MKTTDVKFTPISYSVPFELRWGYPSRDDEGATSLRCARTKGHPREGGRFARIPPPGGNAR